MVAGSIDMEITGSGKVGGSSRISKSRSARVSPVTTFFTPIKAHMSPEYAVSMSSRSFDFIIIKREILSDLRVRGLYNVEPFRREPW